MLSPPMLLRTTWRIVCGGKVSPAVSGAAVQALTQWLVAAEAGGAAQGSSKGRMAAQASNRFIKRPSG
jgi:hypothetical protein